MSYRPPISEREIQVALKMKADGFSQALIAERLGRPTSAIDRILRRAKEQQEKAAAHD